MTIVLTKRFSGVNARVPGSAAKRMAPPNVKATHQPVHAPRAMPSEPGHFKCAPRSASRRFQSSHSHGDRVDPENQPLSPGRSARGDTPGAGVSSKANGPAERQSDAPTRSRTASDAFKRRSFHACTNQRAEDVNLRFLTETERIRKNQPLSPGRAARGDTRSTRRQRHKSSTEVSTCVPSSLKPHSSSLVVYDQRRGKKSSSPRKHTPDAGFNPQLDRPQTHQS